ncbi:hypothetical protein DL764_007993 [Monosporascus ibericus]|uniref:Uncharacterized protein n=1 Tax=Monosporascus ibericus TaxID=155417 RepID=A0A4Q4T0T3_9PEZI|nr:hypothetical protein DL764_007993 [Monosporascus ibericus]
MASTGSVISFHKTYPTPEYSRGATMPTPTAPALGGIIVKSALIHSDTARQGALHEHRSIKVATHGIIFMGTPHQGGNGVQLGRLLANVASLFVAADDRILQHLERDSEWLQQQLGQYGPISGDFITKFAYEEYETPTAFGHTIMVVPRASAVVPGQADAEPIVIHADHHRMVKFFSKEDIGYVTISEHLQIMISNAESNVRSRWEAEARVAEEYSATIWLNARDETSLKQSFARAANRILREHQSVMYVRNAVDSQDLDEIVRAVKRWLDQPHNNNWLVVYDNYDEPKLDHYEEESVHIYGTSQRNPDGGVVGQDEIASSKAFDIRPFLPEIYHGAIVITTRSSTVDIGQQVPVGKLKNIDDGLAILGSMSNRQNLKQDAAAVKIAGLLDGLPLALSTAGAYLKLLTTSWAEYLMLYQKYWLRLQKSSPKLSSYDRALYSTWNISYAHVKRHNLSSANLLRLWAYFDKEDLWFELLQSGRSDAALWFQELTQDRLNFDQVMRVLCDHGLVEADPPTKECGAESLGYSIHGCVHSWIINVLTEGTDEEMVRLSIKCVGFHVPAQDETGYWIVQGRLLLHADRCAEMINSGLEPDDGDEWITGAFGNLYADQGRLKDAEAMYERALQGKEKAWGPEHTSTLDTVNNLGILYADQGRLKDAEAMYKRALQGYEKAWGPEHTSTLTTVNNLGILYADQGRLKDAEAMYERAVQGYEKAWGPEHTSTLDIVNNLGLLYADQGRLKDAKAMYDRALQGKEKAWGPEHTSTLATVNNLGILYADQGRLKDAKAMYDRALQGKEKVWGPEHTSTLDTINNLGLLYADQGRVYADQGRLYADQGRLKDAEAMYERALQGYEKAWGPEHTSTLTTVNNLGNLYVNQGRLKDAEAMYDRALQGYEKVWGPEHTSTLDTINNLGILYKNQSRLKDAEAMYERALQGKEKH